MHNDSGDTARVFALDGTGAVRGTYSLTGATAIDWEDITVVAGATPGSGTIYAADIGDNAADPHGDPALPRGRAGGRRPPVRR